MSFTEPRSDGGHVIALHQRWAMRRNDRPGARTLLGRDKELRQLQDASSELAHGRGSVLAIKGPAGIGKTALASSLAEHVEARGLPVIWARGDQLGQIRPFGCLIDALDCRLQHPDPARRRVADALVSSASTGPDPFRFDTDGAWRFPVQESLLDLVLGLVDDQALLLVVDDVQWADAGSIGVLVALARRCASAPLLLSWTVRPNTEPLPLDQLRDRLDPDLLTEITVGPLGPEDTRRLGAQLTGQLVDSALGARLDRAAGNPFFISALAAGDDAATPADAVLGRIQSLPAATIDLLSVAAVIGLHFGVAELRLMTDHATPELHVALGHAIDEDLVLPFGLGRFGFAHDLIRSAIEADLPASMRAALHRDAARAMQSSGADAGVVAHHLARGARPGDEVAAEQIRVACERVVRHDAPSACELLDSAAGLCVPGSLTWIAVVADRVMALQWSGDGHRALALADQALAQPMAIAASIRLRIARAAALGLIGDMIGAADEYRTLGEDPDVDPSARAQLLAELATIDAWGLDRERARNYAHQALELGRATGNLQAELQALCAWSTQATFDGDLQEGIDQARLAVERGRSFTGPSPARELYLALALGLADQHEEAAIWMQSGLRAADEVSDLWMLSRYQLGRMSLALLTGDWEAATADAEAVISLNADTGMVTGMPHAPSLAGIIAVSQGADRHVLARFRTLSHSIPPELAELSSLVFLGWFEALVAEADGDLPTAVATMGFLVDSTVAMAPLAQTWMGAELVRLALAAGDRPRAEAVTSSLETLAAKMKSASALGIRDHSNALLALDAGDRDGAAGFALRAASALRAAGWRPSLLRSLRLAVAADPSIGDREDGSIAAEIRVLETALGMTRRGGVGGAVNRADLLATDDVFRWLTPMERTIAELVAAGLTNPGIAQQLSISKRTVEYHISNVYSKLAVANRVAIANMVRSRR